MQKRSKKPNSQVTCAHCKIGRKPTTDPETGIRWHSYKESNGIDYDNYVSPCADQTKQGLTAYKKQSLEYVTEKVVAARSRLNILQANAKRIKGTKEATVIQMAVLRVQNLF